MQSADPLIASLNEWREVSMRHSMNEMMLYAKETGLSMPQLGVLFRVHKASCGVSSVGEHLGVTNAAASQMLDRLVQLGLISRTEDPQDRRAKRIVLTEKGLRIVHGSTGLQRSWLKELVETLTPQEKDQIIAAFNILIRKSGLVEVQEGCED